MKKNALFLAIFAISIVAITSCHRSHGINISVKNNEDLYQFSASFNEYKTDKIEQLINSKISPNELFSSKNDYVDATTVLPDKTKFRIKASPGELRIKLDKTENSHSSYLKVKEMCDEIKDVILEK